VGSGADDWGDDEWAPAFRWIERELGGRVVRAERQPRWRPAWFVDVERNGVIEALYLRGERGGADHGVYPLRHEYQVLCELQANGVMVPRVYGWCDEPPSILMSRAPGRFSLSTTADDDERCTVLLEYIAELTKIHAIDLHSLLSLDPASRLAANGALADLDRWEAAYRSRKPGPEPLIEFGLRWVKAHAPALDAPPALIHGDSGQFLFDGGHLSAVYDFELAYVGDPVADLACLVLRDISEPMGELLPAIEHYGALVGHPVDLDHLRFHVARFALCTPMSVAHVVADPRAQFNPLQYLTWSVSFGRITIEFMAKLSGVALDPPEPLPEFDATAETKMHDALVELLSPADGRDDATAYQFETSQRIALYLQRLHRHGAVQAERERRDVAALTGRTFSTAAEADEHLDAMAMSDEALDEKAWLRYLYRRTMRRQQLIEPAMARHRNRHAQLLD